MPRRRRQEFPDFSKETNAARKMFNKLTTVIGNMALNFFDDSWERQGFVDKGLRKWPPRKKQDRNQRRRGRRALLIQSGHLRRSGRFRLSGNRIIFSYAGYGKVHNEGFHGKQKVPKHTRNPKGKKKHTVRAHTRQMDIPKRQFVGHSHTLDKRIEKHLDRQMDQIFGR